MIGKLLCALMVVAVGGMAADVPSVSAEMGPCSARFTVTDGAKPLYNAKVRTRIKHGAFGFRKLDLEVGTDVNGQALITHLPDRAKYPITFDISQGDISRTVLFEPEKKCDATFEVQLRKPTVPAPAPESEKP